MVRRAHHRRLADDEGMGTDPPTHPITASARFTRRRRRSRWTDIPGLALAAIVLTVLVQVFLARIFVIPSASMERTLQGCSGCSGCSGCTNDKVLTDRVTYQFVDPSPGDVVVFKGPPAWRVGDADNTHVEPSSNPLVRSYQNLMSALGAGDGGHRDFVKRVIAVGGQTVECCDQQRVVVDGRALNEPYLNLSPEGETAQAEFAPVRVPEGQLWVMGDNRNSSADARVHGPVPVSAVIGRVRAIVLPISRWRSVPSVDPQVVALGAPPAVSARRGPDPAGS